MSIQTSVMFFLVIAYPSAIVSLGAPFLLLMLATSLIMLVLLFKYLPETKGRPVDEIFRRLTMGRTSDSDALLEAQFLQQQEDSSSSSSSDYGSFDGIESNAVV
jgi:ABC-type microcin C transport system permease subunit YejB